MATIMFDFDALVFVGALWALHCNRLTHRQRGFMSSMLWAESSRRILRKEPWLHLWDDTQQYKRHWFALLLWRDPALVYPLTVRDMVREAMRLDMMTYGWQDPPLRPLFFQRRSRSKNSVRT